MLASNISLPLFNDVIFSVFEYSCTDTCTVSVSENARPIVNIKHYLELIQLIFITFGAQT